MVMVAAAAVQADDASLAVAVFAGLVVLVGTAFRPIATVAVLLVAAAIVLDDTPLMVTALCGLSAAGYLVLRHTAAASTATVLGAVGFTAVVLMAAAVPLQMPWVPLLAPLAVLALVVIVSRPYWVDRSR
jgi:hypothetical protein